MPLLVYRSARELLSVSAELALGVRVLGRYSPKYLHLLALLEKVGAVRVPSEIYRAIPTDILQHLRNVENLA